MNSILIQTLRQRDVLPLFMCQRLYDICRNEVFEDCTPLEFATFLNLRESTVQLRDGGKRRAWYMIYAVAGAFSSRAAGQAWEKEILASLGQDLKNYKKHRTTIGTIDAPPANKKFKKQVDEIVAEWMNNL